LRPAFREQGTRHCGERVFDQRRGRSARRHVG
jgi:hypothetical protein